MKSFVRTALIAVTLSMMLGRDSSVRACEEFSESDSLLQVGRAGMALIPAGDYAPLLRTKDEPERVSVAAFWLDARPVTNAEFLEFVRSNPAWRRSRVGPL